MQLSGRIMALGCVVIAATTLGASAIPSIHATQVATAATTSTAPCLPNPVAAGVLPTLPVIDANTRPAFTLYVKQGVSATGGASTYCYVSTPGGDRSYVEAPTIHIRQGGSFTMTLRNMIPSPAPTTPPTAVPTPPTAIMETPDGCAWLPFDGPLPSPNPSAVPGGYYGHQRVTYKNDPPWMLANDTNFHTHGWHVDPYVDNVYKSLVWAPNTNTCVFTFKVPLTQPPGTYWYHAHLHGLSDAQVGGGLAGALVVDPAPPAPPDAATILLVKNSPYAQGNLTRSAPLSATSGMGTMRSPMLGRPAPAAHYSALEATAGRRLVAAPNATSVPYSAFSPGPWNSGIAWPSPAPGYCPAAPTSVTGVLDPMAVNGAQIPAVINGVPVPLRGPSALQLVNSIRHYSIINALSDSFLNVETVTDNGTVVPLVVVARDGVPVNWNFETSKVDPRKPSSVVVPNVFVPPSGRVEIAVLMTGGRPLTIASAAGSLQMRSATNTPYCVGYFGFGTQPRRNILRINPFYGPSRTYAERAAPPRLPTQQHAVRTAAAQLVVDDLPKVTRSRAVTFTMYPSLMWNVTETGDYAGANPPPSVKPLPFTERPFWLAAGPNAVRAKYPYVPWIRVHKNDVEEWYIYNATGEIHAFHIHQLTFVALDSPFEATNPYQQVFLDSIPLPAGMLANPSVAPATGSFPLLRPSLTRILIDFRNVDPGVFVFHCHMLFHEDNGMMGVIEVLPPVKAVR